MCQRSSRTARRVRWAAFVTLLVSFPLTADGGAMFFAGKLVDGRFVAAEGDKTPAFDVDFSTTRANVQRDRAEVTVTEQIAGHAPDAKTIVCVVPLPAGVDSIRSTQFAPAFNGSGAMKLLSVDESRKLFESIAEQTGNVAIATLGGRRTLVATQFPDGWLDGRTTITYSYTSPVGTDAGLCDLRCMLPATVATRRAARRVSLTVSLSADDPLRAVFSPTHEVAVQRDGLFDAVVRMKASDWTGHDDFRLLWAADRDELGLRVLAYRPDGEEDEDGYFMLLGNPTGNAEPGSAAPKDVSFVLDTSGSMRGEKIEQARAAVRYCLGRLNPNDRFNIVTFGTEVATFRDAPVQRSDKALADAAGFVEDVVARGRTNIAGALTAALRADEQARRVRIVIFLTDGTPTAGQLVPEKILEAARKANTAESRVFVVGLGHDVNAHLLDKLGEANGGSSEYVEPEEEIDAKVAALYNRLSHPVLADAVATFGTLQTHSVYPAELPALFVGSEIMIAGRYRGGGEQTFSIQGTLSGKPVEYACRAELPKTSGGASHEFVAPLWAARKIGFLLQEIRLHGENDELIEEVVRLSKQYGIVTEYTEFLAEAGGDLNAADAVAEARRQMHAANSIQSGKWAVNQAFNDRELQGRKVAGNERNTYRDRQGNLVRNANISQIGRQVFYLRDGQWVDGREAGRREEQVVTLFSDEYYELLRKEPEFARAQQLGWAVSMNVGNRRVVVEKDGKQQDQRLLEQQQLRDRQGQAAPDRGQQFNQLQQLPNQQRNLQQRGAIQNVRNQLPLNDVQLQQLQQDLRQVDPDNQQDAPGQQQVPDIQRRNNR